MKLYDVPEGSTLKLPITDGKETKTEMCKFFHIDGMYSYIETEKGHPVHLEAICEMRKVDDYYEMEYNE